MTHRSTPTGREALTPDGVRISYDDLGQGEPALLLLPGWAHSRRVHELLAPLTAAHRLHWCWTGAAMGALGPRLATLGTPTW